MQRLLWLAALVSIACLAPTMGWAGDQETSEQIADSLRSQLKNYSVGVRVQDGTVWLNGFVATQKQMAAAVETAQKSPGIERVVNNLSIGSPPSAAAPGGRSDLRQPSNMAGSPNGAPSEVDENRLNGLHSSSAYRQPVVEASMELPEHAQQQLLVAGPIPDMADEPAPTSSNKQPSRDQLGQVQGSPNYYAGYAPAPAGYAQTPAGYAAMNAGYAPANMGNAPGAPGMMRSMGQQTPLPIASANAGPYRQAAMQNGGPGPGNEMIGAPQPLPAASPMGPGAPAPYHFDHPQMPGYAWPSYAAYPNYAAVTYPKQYSPTAWPYIGPFYPYPQVPLGWRKVTLEWDDGWWFLDFKDSH
jgi:hypothetical protein